ncbi:formate-dependent phosphoribosylglycinamide formyltransferase [Maridesulfovibrio salexigens]|uniref:Formate-dependent phosphoribosylglycinamide formyltransferase n=1 Tax=Maridesulfovibrio salexigens (strain ATCC 14822 / DSM 2638 / NCIMB 8403 / VKM B-1763) TaxID=526222 RepID=PURT_MARSD|nr:formate-dependent phosphoribosylglycinamide formyltransferase [Maridesulfovibrio salexigens]C6BV99.1 RecName: Full=Formate-dependent phosphoribosylglycinamide formyltransferase; AltName: Full=5'-phosphoribosylglycinamide transformylase 2; AltName: Full=Formate-dependent GAR transformylase; AltName: Full=GAR transformylase 2; Short=GART 2; AltName: Full=Non-folate glycinamide ribonucleotide transformylase; AltName: Full=Phosphoribosylglycinamide formyltransferase 2 [Maridesulfovibrio salexigens 
MVTLGTAGTASARKMMLLGGGELGKEVVIEAQRLGVEVIVVDRYENTPAMQVAHRSYVISMLDTAELRRVVETEKPDYIVPEIEAIATETLLELEKEGFNVVPTARATRLTMDREGIRRLAAEEVGLKTSPYKFADTKEEYLEAIKEIGIPCVIKPVMSSSGKGQSTVKSEADVDRAWDYSQSGGRTGEGRIIVESFVDFDYEITLLTVRHAGGTSYCAPIGHRQDDGDYRESWQPQPMSDAALANAQDYALRITDALGGRGLFGVELFIKGEEVIFSEVSPRPHDTGLVTVISQDLSEFALHVRAILGLPIPAIRQYGPAASSVILSNGKSEAPAFANVDKALEAADTKVLIFGKGECNGVRRLGVALALGEDVTDAKARAIRASSAVEIEY